MLIKTQNTDLGYLCLDHRASGDLPPGVQSPMFEAATYTCSHCQTVVIMNPQRRRERETCRGCNHMICDPCAAKKAAGAPCKTMNQIIDEFIQAEAVRQAESPIILP